MIKFNNVNFAYKEEPVFSGLDMTVDAGSFVLVTGESGVGKTTFIKLITAELKPDAGKILVDGKDITKLKDRDLPAYRRNMGVVFQDFRLLEESTVYENLDIVRQVVGLSRKESERKITSILTLLGMQDKCNNIPLELSGGERQRLCIGRALMNNPRLLIADEPTGNLDPANSREIMKIFSIIRSQGITVVVATHNVDAAEGFIYKEFVLSDHTGHYVTK